MSDSLVKSSRAIVILGLVASSLLYSRSLWAQTPSVALSVQSRQIYAEVPFVLQVTASGFDESPQPEVADFKIDGASVTFLGVSPSVMSRRSIVNGVISSSRDVRFVYNYRIEASRDGSFEIPEILVSQGSMQASSPPSRFSASDVANSQDMRISMKVPDRPVWIGESFEVDVDWYLRLNPREQTFVIPIFGHPAFEVEEPESKSDDRLAFEAGDKELNLPYLSSKVVEGGTEYTRFQFKAVATPTQAGRFELDAPRVVAKLQVGTGRDDFGFRSTRYDLFKATGAKTSFEVKALPLSGRPASFSGAVGSGFSIKVTTSRSVVSVGEPIELTVTLGGKRGLAGLGLPTMVGPGALDPAVFEVIGNEGTGQLSEDGRTKTFKVTAVLNSAEARAIPPIEFAFFDPEDASYKTTSSDPIALNVGSAAMVGANDVVGQSRDGKSGPESGVSSKGAFTGDLTPSAASETLRRLTSLGTLRPALIGLYALPLFLFGVMLYLRRTGESRNRSGALRQALREVEAAAKEAAKKPASESAAILLKAVRELGRATGNKPGPWTSEMETLAFDPKRCTEPVDAALIEQALDQARGWCKKAGQGVKGANAVAGLVLLVILGASGSSFASDMDRARASYTAALEIADRGERTKAFAATERIYSELVKGNRDRPELLTDWGNAALGAGELGTAVLAYRRALKLDRGLSRAKANLQWARQQMPERLVASDAGGAVDSLFFWHSDWSLATRHLVAAIAFALTILLVTPWGSRYQRGMRRVALLPFLLFVATIGSALLESHDRSDAVVVRDGQTLYSADSLGAPVAMSALVPAGLEVKITERRASWTQILLADGTRGWLASSAVELVE